MPTRKTLKASLKASRQRLPHGYELVARKKRAKVTKRRVVKRKATKKRK